MKQNLGKEKYIVIISNMYIDTIYLYNKYQKYFFISYTH